MNIHDFFPNLPQSIPEVDLNKEAILYLKELGSLDVKNSWQKSNPLIKPEECEKFIQWVHRKYNTEFSYGGYGEDRSTLWHGTYLEQLGAFYHLGIDINIPAGTVLHSPISGKVILSDHDRDYPSAPQDHGWGNRLIIDPEIGEHLLILAHLSDSTKRKIDSTVQKGEKLGTIGKSTENGGWFEHFHVQAIRRTRFQELLNTGNISELDGYAVSMDDAITNTYPHPFQTF